MFFDPAKLRRNMWQGALTNYLKAAIRLLKTIFLTRLLLFHLGEDYYGFWGLLWAVFGYVLIFELGFGKTVQKYAAEAVSLGSFDKFQKIAGAIYTSYLAIGLVIAVATAAGAWFLPSLVKLPPGQENYCQTVFLIFGLGCAVVFPTGIIPEILAGLQCLHYRNWVIVLNQVLELLGIWLIFRAGGSLLAIAIFVAVNNILSNIIMWYAITRLLPGFRLRAVRLDRGTLREIVSFSGYIYLLAISKMVLLKADPLILGSMTGLGAVAVFQLGTRIPEIVKVGGGQFQETLGPAAAMYYHNGNKKTLLQLLMKSQRLSVFVSFGALAIFWPLTPAIMHVWLKLDTPDVLEMSSLMLFNILIFVALRDTAREFLLMTGQHRFIMWTSLAEALVKVGLCVLFVHLYGVIGIAWGNLLPNVVIAFGFILPATVRYMELSWRKYLASLFLPVLPATAAVLIPLWLLCAEIPPSHWTIWKLGGVMAVAGMLYLGISYICCLHQEERLVVQRILKEKLRR